MNTFLATVQECHQVIRLLLARLGDLSIRFDALVAENKKLKLAISQLKERLNNNLLNSSLPPSKSFKKKTNNRQASGKKSGGQPGHSGHYRKLLPIDEVSSIELCELPTTCVCGGEINASTDYVRYQVVYELSELKLRLTEYQMQKERCINCGKKYLASLPIGVIRGITGPRLTSFMSENHAENGLRHLVIWRKKYFCTRPYCSDYVARNALINTTCKLQNKSSFNFMCELLQNYFSVSSPPALIAA